jgi:hypothetical protein
MSAPQDPNFQAPPPLTTPEPEPTAPAPHFVFWASSFLR